MARRRGGRGSSNSTASFAAPPVEAFDDDWLNRIRSRPDIRFVDLTKIEDRRRWNPTQLDRTKAPAKTIYGTRARIVVVPEGHRLARLQTYAGRLRLDQVIRGQGKLYSKPRWTKDAWEQGPNYYPYVRSYTYENVSSRIGFANPWQVVICVRRKRRKEVMFATGRAGKGGQKSPKRNWYSEVRC